MRLPHLIAAEGGASLSPQDQPAVAAWQNQAAGCPPDWLLEQPPLAQQAGWALQAQLLPPAWACPALLKHAWPAAAPAAPCQARQSKESQAGSVCMARRAADSEGEEGQRNTSSGVQLEPGNLQCYTVQCFAGVCALKHILSTWTEILLCNDSDESTMQHDSP